MVWPLCSTHCLGPSPSPPTTRIIKQTCIAHIQTSVPCAGLASPRGYGEVPGSSGPLRAFPQAVQLLQGAAGSGLVLVEGLALLAAVYPVSSAKLRPSLADSVLNHSLSVADLAPTVLLQSITGCNSCESYFIAYWVRTDHVKQDSTATFF